MDFGFNMGHCSSSGFLAIGEFLCVCVSVFFFFLFVWFGKKMWKCCFGEKVGIIWLRMMFQGKNVGL